MLVDLNFNIVSCGRNGSQQLQIRNTNSATVYLRLHKLDSELNDAGLDPAPPIQGSVGDAGTLQLTGNTIPINAGQSIWFYPVDLDAGKGTPWADITTVTKEQTSAPNASEQVVRVTFNRTSPPANKSATVTVDIHVSESGNPGPGRRA